jgi:hypothetical protein
MMQVTGESPVHIFGLSLDADVSRVNFSFQQNLVSNCGLRLSTYMLRNTWYYSGAAETQEFALTTILERQRGCQFRSAST